MGIYLKGIDMPKADKNVAICITIWANGDVTTEFGKQVIGKAIPAHGDLIDRTATVGKICAVGEMIEERLGYDKGAPYYAAALYIQDNKTDFPAIIPAEEGET